MLQCISQFGSNGNTVGYGIIPAARLQVRFTTAAGLVTELTETKNKSELNRVPARWMHYELIVIDQMS
jgi:DNA replication protein DnaC